MTFEGLHRGALRRAVTNHRAPQSYADSSFGVSRQVGIAAFLAGTCHGHLAIRRGRQVALRAKLQELAALQRASERTRRGVRMGSIVRNAPDQSKSDPYPAAPRAAFPTTHWSLVLHASAGDDTAARAALETLCRQYWYPIYAFVRRQGRGHHEAEDCTQAFLTRLLASDGVARARSGAWTFSRLPAHFGASFPRQRMAQDAGGQAWRWRGDRVPRLAGSRQALCF